MLHVHQDENQFYYFGQTLIEFEKDIDGIIALGADREKAIVNGLGRSLPIATVLACTRHVEKNCVQKMSELGISAAARNTIMQDIFGSEDKKEKGLIDCETVADFDSRLESIEERWETIEKNDRKSNCPKFYKYFVNNVARDMKASMLKPVRNRCGLGDNFFYNNGPESLHSKYKLQIRQHKLQENAGGIPERKFSWSEAADQYRGMVNRVKRNIHRAIIGEGPYQLTPAYSNLQIDVHSWLGMTDRSKLKQLRKIDPSATEKDLSSSFNNSQIDASQSEQTSVEIIGSFAASGLPEMFRGSWINADEIVRMDGIGDVPGQSNMKICMSLSKDEPHFLRVTNSGKKLSCNCEGYKSKNLCAHVIATAYKLKTLEDIILLWEPNLSRQLSTSLPAGCGKKANEKKKRKRKRTSDRDTSQYSERNVSEDDKYHVVFLSETRATTCYGCEQKVRFGVR